MRSALLLLLLLLPSCASHRASRRASPRARSRVVISLVGTNDLHGRIALLPWLGGHLANLRSARRADGAVLLVDAGDLFQGTLASNLTEGAAVVRAYNALGYAAAAIGNHEFDYGPSGEATFPRAPSDDPRGALRARAREASFPFLAANIVEASSGHSPRWDNVSPDLLTTVAGVRVGIVGVSTEATPTTTLAVNFRGLAMRPLADTVSARAASLRARGAAVVVVLAHAGGGCRRFDQPDDLSTCDAREEVFELARALPEGGVDAIVAGHTHRGVAHVVHGIPVIESFANGEAFGRVDLTVERGRVTGRQVFPPRGVCGEISREPADPSRCAPAPYEGAPVVADEAVARIVAGPLADARAVEERSLGVVVERGMRSRYQEESALTNLVADRMLAAAPGADVALMNSGGVRADLPEGALDYGEPVFRAALRQPAGDREDARIGAAGGAAQQRARRRRGARPRRGTGGRHLRRELDGAAGDARRRTRRGRRRAAHRGDQRLPRGRIALAAPRGAIDRRRHRGRAGDARRGGGGARGGGAAARG